MSRSLKKPLFVNEKLMQKIEKLNKIIAKLSEQGKQEEINKVRNTPIRVWFRSSTIFPGSIGYVFDIHNGKKFLRRQITPEMVGCKFGEFAPTRKLGKHGKAGTH